MNDTELVQTLVDSLDTGLPERPDLAPVRSAGARQRGLRRLGWAAGACSAAVAVVVPVALVSGGGSPSTLAPDLGPGPAAAPAPVGPPAGPEFGVGMRSAVEQAVPGATFESEQLGDSWHYVPDKDAYFMGVSDPVHWETLFGWSQEFGLPDGGHLGVIATRTSTNAFIGGAGAKKCDEAIFPSRQSCDVGIVEGHLVMVNDGIQYDDHGRWAREVDVFYSKTTSEMPAHVELTAYVDAPSWEQARDALPSADELTTLGLEPALELPAPDHYPVPDDLQEHMTTTE